MKAGGLELKKWLKANLGNLGELTSVDWEALVVADAIVRLKSYEADAGLAAAFAAVVSKMQVKCRRYAYHAIARHLEWYSREQLWTESGLPPIAQPGVCAYEPGGSAR